METVEGNSFLSGWPMGLSHSRLFSLGHLLYLTDSLGGCYFWKVFFVDLIFDIVTMLSLPRCRCSDGVVPTRLATASTMSKQAKSSPKRMVFASCKVVHYSTRQMYCCCMYALICFLTVLLLGSSSQPKRVVQRHEHGTSFVHHDNHCEQEVVCVYRSLDVT